jgi:hypothetical protein
MLFNCIIIAWCLVILTANGTVSASKASRLGKLELENINYQIDIERVLQVDSVYSQQTNNDVPLAQNRVRIKSVYGQMYECELPDIKSTLESLNEYEEDEGEELLRAMAPSISNFDPSSFFETSSQVKTTKQYNFTLINEKVNIQMAVFKNSKMCSYRVKKHLNLIIY